MKRREEKNGGKLKMEGIRENRPEERREVSGRRENVGEDEEGGKEEREDLRRGRQRRWVTGRLSGRERRTKKSMT